MLYVNVISNHILQIIEGNLLILFSTAKELCFLQAKIWFVIKSWREIISKAIQNYLSHYASKHSNLEKKMAETVENNYETVS